MPVSALPVTRAAIAYSAPAAASSVAWYLANGTIDSGNVVYHDENVAAGTKYDGTTLTGDWTWAAKFDAVQPASNTAIMDSSTNNATDYWLRHTSSTGEITLLAPDGSVNGIMADGSRVVFLVVDETGGTAKVYVDNSEVISITTVNPGEFLGGGVGDLWASTMYANADYLELINIAIDGTQRAALYAAMTA